MLWYFVRVNFRSTPNAPCLGDLGAMGDAHCCLCSEPLSCWWARWLHVSWTMDLCCLWIWRVSALSNILIWRTFWIHQKKSNFTVAMFGREPFTNVVHHARLPLTAFETRRSSKTTNAEQIWGFVWCRNNGGTGECQIRLWDLVDRGTNGLSKMG